MKILQIVLLVFVLFNIGNGQKKQLLTELGGSVIDQAGASISSTRIVLTNTQGKRFETVSNDEGLYIIRLPAGTYTIEPEFTNPLAWEQFKVEKYEKAATKRMTLDISLRISEEFIKEKGTPVISNPIHKP
jgi:hypothetical protein